MSKNKVPEPKKESSSLLGWMALFAVVAAIVVFAFTRSPQPEPASQVASTPQASPAQTPAQPPPAAQDPAQATAPAPQQTTAPAQQTESPDSHAGHNHASPSGGASQPLPPFHENPDLAEPLALVRDPNIVAPHAKEAYQVAMQKPRLMAQLPCFCYCNRFGHKSLHDCFVTNHAEECDICMKEALEAGRMETQGMSPQEIRSIIISTYQQRS